MSSFSPKSLSELQKQVGAWADKAEADVNKRAATQKNLLKGRDLDGLLDGLLDKGETSFSSDLEDLLA